MLPQACALSRSPLVNREDLTSTSHPMLGVLFFSRSTPSHKGAMHTLKEKSSSQLASQGRATTLYSRWVSQLPQEKLVKKIRHYNLTHASRDSFLFSSIYFIYFFLVTFPFSR
jgi:hypothetical protein